MSKASIETDMRDYGLYDWPRENNLHCSGNFSNPPLTDNEAKLFDSLMKQYHGYELSKCEIKTVLQAFERLKRLNAKSVDIPNADMLRTFDAVPVKGSITDACIGIQNDLLSCPDVISLGRKYVTYQNILKSFFLKGLDEIVNREEK